MTLFENSIQELKHSITSEVARLAFQNSLEPEKLMNIANIVIPDGSPKLRCCIYKERAIVNERVKIALGGSHSPGVIQVLKIACDECPVEGMKVTAACRGCIAHRCMHVCPKQAIKIVERHAVIDKDKCVECGKCVGACYYSAIVKQSRPCVTACKVEALAIDEDTKKALIRPEKCISCGACVYRCPFGAIVDKSFIVQAIRMLTESRGGEVYRVYAIVAPSFASQYASVSKITIEQVVTGIKGLGFHSVIEAALGADMVAASEAVELAEKGFLTSSCCPSFVEYVAKNFPELTKSISQNLSPMAQLARVIKSTDPFGKVVFFGPCISKKAEAQREEVRRYVDCVLTFEEMQALFDAKDIDLAKLPETPLDNASYFGRIFARSGGLSDAVVQALKEKPSTDSGFVCKPVVCNGLTECRTALLKASHGKLEGNFIEGMACEGGCIGGPGCLNHSSRDRTFVDSYGKKAVERTIGDAIFIFENSLVYQGKKGVPK